MERKITLSSFAVRYVKGNRPGNSTTRFIPVILILILKFIVRKFHKMFKCALQD